MSDRNLKENFRDLVGEHVPARLATMPIQEWNDKSQDASIRHVGPTAQDFRTPFGMGEHPLRINTIDADGNRVGRREGARGAYSGTGAN